jgi:hypothetical protein
MLGQVRIVKLFLVFDTTIFSLEALQFLAYKLRIGRFKLVCCLKKGNESFQ